MLRAALASRSWTVPHMLHCHARRLSGWGPSRLLHLEQVWEVGSQRLILTTWRPCWAALCSNRRMKAAHPASWTLLASRVRPTLPRRGPRRRPLDSRGSAAGRACGGGRPAGRGPCGRRPRPAPGPWRDWRILSASGRGPAGRGPNAVRRRAGAVGWRPPQRFRRWRRPQRTRPGQDRSRPCGQPAAAVSGRAGPRTRRSSGRRVPR